MTDEAMLVRCSSLYRFTATKMPTVPIEINVGDVVQTRKPHPCGGDTWAVVRIGAEIGMRCTTCDRKVFLPRSIFERRVKRFISRAEAAPETKPQVSSDHAD